MTSIRGKIILIAAGALALACITGAAAVGTASATTMTHNSVRQEPLPGPLCQPCGPYWMTVSSGPYTYFLQGNSHGSIATIDSPNSAYWDWIKNGDTYDGYSEWEVQDVSQATTGYEDCLNAVNTGAGPTGWAVYMDSCQNIPDELFLHIGNWIVPLGATETTCSGDTSCAEMQAEAFTVPSDVLVYFDQGAGPDNQWTLSSTG